MRGFHSIPLSPSPASTAVLAGSCPLQSREYTVAVATSESMSENSNAPITAMAVDFSMSAPVPIPHVILARRRGRGITRGHGRPSSRDEDRAMIHEIELAPEPHAPFAEGDQG